MTDEVQTITIDDVEYEWEALPDGIKHIVNQISHCRMEVERLVLETQRMEMMQRGYTSELKDGMKEFLEQ